MSPASARAGANTPLTVADTTESCEALTGLPPHLWRRALVELSVPHARVGRRTLCLAADWLAAVQRRSGVEPSGAERTEAEIVQLAARGRGRR